jgi:hypothetical protein
MSDGGDRVRRWIVIVAVLVILVICIGVTIHLWQQTGFTLDLHNLHGLTNRGYGIYDSNGYVGAVFYLLHDLFLIWFKVLILMHKRPARGYG